MGPPNQPFDPSLLDASFPSNNSNDVNNGHAAYDNYDFDFLMNNDTSNTAAVFSGDVGANLGFDGQHDWADGGGQLPDLFQGFFFGPQAVGESGMDGGEGFAGVEGGRYDEGIWNGPD